MSAEERAAQTRTGGEDATASVVVSPRTIDAALACLAAMAAHEQEPDRYRGWYAAAYEELAAAYKTAKPVGRTDHG